MRRSAPLALALLATLSACAPRRPSHLPEMSGFLDDYVLLRPGGANELALVYRNPKAQWTTYNRVLMEPVSIWRSGRKSLEPVPKPDLVRLVADFDAAVRTRLGEGFPLVDRPGPGVMQVRLAITEARASDPILDVLTAPSGTVRPHSGDGPLDPETKRFLAGAAVEGEIRDAQTGVLLAQGVDRPRRVAAIETWGDLDRALAFWADRVCGRLEARAGR